MKTLVEQHHIVVESDGDGRVVIRQVDHSGNENYIALHLSQVRHLAEVTGTVESAPIPSTYPKLNTGGDSMYGLDVLQGEDGNIWIEQTRTDGMGGVDVSIDLHPVQAAWLAEKLQSILGGGSYEDDPCTSTP
jgi:hypothetical protein